MERKERGRKELKGKGMVLGRRDEEGREIRIRRDMKGIQGLWWSILRGVWIEMEKGRKCLALGG